MKQNDEDITTRPARVAATPQQAGEAPARRDPWWWVERGVWTEAMLTRLASGESANRVWYTLVNQTEPDGWFARRGRLSLAAEHEWTRTIVRLRTH